MTNEPSHRTPQPTPVDRWVAVLVLAVIVVGCFFVLMPFLTALLWGFVLVCTTWPVFHAVRRLVRGSDSWASLIMTLGIAAALIGPFVVVGFSLADDASQLFDAGRRALAEGPPHAPAWLSNLPLIGSRAAAYWDDMVSDRTHMLAELKENLDPIRDVRDRQRRGTRKRIAATRVLGVHRVLSVSRRRSDGAQADGDDRAHFWRARTPSRRAGGQYHARGRLRHPGHRAGAGCAGRDRSRNCGRARCRSARIDHLLPLADPHRSATDMAACGRVAVLSRTRLVGRSSSLCGARRW